eukprot:3934649-Amphidinium_carterae.1
MRLRLKGSQSSTRILVQCVGFQPMSLGFQLVVDYTHKGQPTEQDYVRDPNGWNACTLRCSTFCTSFTASSVAK